MTPTTRLEQEDAVKEKNALGWAHGEEWGAGRKIGRRWHSELFEAPRRHGVGVQFGGGHAAGAGMGVQYGYSGGRGSGRWLNPSTVVPGRWLKQGRECAYGKGLRYGGPAARPLLWAGPKEQWHLWFIQNNSNEFDMIGLKYEFPIFENFQIKYGIEGFDERNNFTYRNFFRFKVGLN
jgi:hypothetical protein